MVLFDEIEKAHPDVLNILLQILDEGRLTDSHGRTVSFVETTIVLTSNLGSVQKGQSHNLGFRAPEADSVKRQFDKEAYRQQVKEALQQHLRPELLNRIQQIVYFYPLDQEALRQIVDKILGNVRARLQSQKIDLTLSNSVYDVIIAAGYDPAFGARELERAVDRLLVIPLGQALLSGQILEGTILQVNAVGNELVLEDVERTRAISLSRFQIEESEN
jgi:ATP-dependent Clp protease ATP-binding subunit ClpA